METHDDEGRIELMSESQMWELLGIRDESAPNTAIPTNDEERHDNVVGQNIDGAAIPTNDEVPGEMVISYDKNNLMAGKRASDGPPPRQQRQNLILIYLNSIK